MTKQHSFPADQGLPADALGQPVLLGRSFGRVTQAHAGSLEHFAQAGLPRTEEDLIGAFPFARGAPGHLYATAPEAMPDRRDAPPALCAPPVPVPEPALYGEAVRSLAARIRQGGPLKKAVLARMLEVRTDRPLDPLQVALRLCEDPDITGYCLPLPPRGAGARWLVGATPELLLDKRGAAIRSHPFAGSAQRSEDPAQDRAAAGALEASAKDRAEHRLVVEYIHDILAPHCRHLSVPKGPALHRTASLWHLGTLIEGELADPETPCLALLAALHPTPAVAGQPLAPALDSIGAAEPFEREFYAGTLGRVTAQNDGTWYVTLRCAIIEGCLARLFAGAGIVGASDPVSEIAETSAKFTAMCRALGLDTPD
ncbi:isochorismate synthase [Pseudoroseicyclus aestuarii]|uniref:isochorismate synthase n=1 Tax=Pseudoroseicyclus aestuarii TaxID=1795041 RepID=A0A318SQY5_9RHOB|nr:isochorismate synthase [Pseudoroseicyclus aestuarii]PYE84351.1 isochorismate synthase [Pseudoroseicyclus aestuarii]